MIASVEHVLQQAVQRLAMIETPTPRLDAQLLLAHVLTKPVSWLMTWPEHKLAIVETDLFETLIERRLQGEPIAYIIGSQEFWSLSLIVTPDVLIPRADTECLIDHILSYDWHCNANFLDLGTGSGAIALALANEARQRHYNWQITATDNSISALAIAQKNTDQLNLNCHIKFIQTNWFNELSQDQLYDVIVSNPPYIEPNDQHLPALRHEPLTALVSADNGLSDIKQIVQQAYAYLKPNGLLIIEHGYNQASDVQSIFTNAGFISSYTGKDLAGLSRYTYSLNKQ